MRKDRKPSPVNGVTLPAGKPFQPGEEAREKGRRGGKKSAEARRAKKALREDLIDLLQVRSKSLEGKEHTQQECIAASLVKEARNGNVRAFEVIRDTIGEKPRDKYEIAAAVEAHFEALDAAFENLK